MRRPRARAFAAALALCLTPFALSVHAQPAPGAAPEGTASGVPAVDPAAEAEAEAQRRYRAGLEMAARGDHSGAAREFEASFGAVPSPNTLLALARSLTELERLPEAVLRYDEAIALAEELAEAQPKYLQTRNVARDERAALAKRVGWVVVGVEAPPEGTEVRVSGRVLPADRWGRAVPVPPGTTAVEAYAPGRVPVRVDVVLGAGAEVRVPVVLVTPDALARQPANARRLEHAGAAPAADDRTELAPFGWASLAVAAAGVGATVTFVVLADGAESDLAERCDPNCTRATYDDIVNRGNTYETLAIVSLGVAVAAAGTGVLLFLLDADAEDAPVRAGLSPTGVALSVRY